MRNETLIAERSEKAEKLGRQAFHAGMMAIPAHDPSLMALIRGFAVGEGGLEVITAWSTGWHAENIALPVN